MGMNRDRLLEILGYKKEENKTYPFKTDIISSRDDFEKINIQKEEN